MVDATYWIVIGAILLSFVFYDRLQRTPPPEPASEPTTTTESNVLYQDLTLDQGTQGQFGDLRIGVESVRLSLYQDAEGNTTDRILTDLHLFVQTDSAKNRVETMGIGQTITIDAYRITVLEIFHVGRGAVTLRIESVEESP